MGMVPFMFFVALTHVSTGVIPFCDSRCIHREGLCLDIGTAVLFVYLILNRCFVSHLHKPIVSVLGELVCSLSRYLIEFWPGISAHVPKFPADILLALKCQMVHFYQQV